MFDTRKRCSLQIKDEEAEVLKTGSDIIDYNQVPRDPTHVCMRDGFQILKGVFFGFKQADNKCSQRNAAGFAPNRVRTHRVRSLPFSSSPPPITNVVSLFSRLKNEKHSR